MVTTVGAENKLEDLVADLIQLDFDAADAYQSAIERLKDAEFQATLALFREDHQRHVDELSEFLSARGDTAQGRRHEELSHPGQGSTGRPHGR